MSSYTPETGSPDVDDGWPQKQITKGKILFPGYLAAVTVPNAARFLSEYYGGPTMLFALLLGMRFHFLSEEGA